MEYGLNEPIGLCRTEHISSHLLSVRINEHKGEEAVKNVKKIAFLIDMQTIHIHDLVTSQVTANISHDSRVDWLELNPHGTKLLFRDKRRALNLYDIPTQTRTTLLNLCSYVQWVPKSDVAVAQSRSDLCIWYNIDHPERVTTIPIKGDVIDIERTKVCKRDSTVKGFRLILAAVADGARRHIQTKSGPG